MKISGRHLDLAVDILAIASVAAYFASMCTNRQPSKAHKDEIAVVERPPFAAGPQRLDSLVKKDGYRAFRSADYPRVVEYPACFSQRDGESGADQGVFVWGPLEIRMSSVPNARGDTPRTLALCDTLSGMISLSDTCLVAMGRGQDGRMYVRRTGTAGEKIVSYQLSYPGEYAGVLASVALRMGFFDGLLW